MKKLVTVLRFKNLQLAWQGINEYLYLEEAKIMDERGGASGSELVSYDNHIFIDTASIDPEFDFGKTLGYSKAKWTALVNNYCDYHYLDMLRAEVNIREQKKARMYNYTLHFTNKYGSGKDCLISLTVARRPGDKKPTLVFTVRTSEVTKRLLFDFLLVQRICEYIFGHSDAHVQFHAQHYYITAESFVMYNNVKPIRRLLKKFLNGDKPRKFQEKILLRFKEYSTHPDPHNVMFRVNRRSMLQIQKDENGEPLSGVKSMKAKDLLLKPIENFPKGVVTKAQIAKYRRTKKNN